MAQNHIKFEMPQFTPSFLLTAVGGWATWANLVELSDLATSDNIIFDQSNDDTSCTPHVEAYIRRAWAYGSRVISVVLPSWTALTDDQINTPYNKTAIEQHRVVCNAYNVPMIDFWTKCQELVPATYHLTDLYADTAHPSVLGCQIIETMLDDLLPTSGAAEPSPLPSRVYASSADFEQTPLIKFGIQYDSRTGTWTDTGNQTESNTVGSTITFSGTFRSFGCYRADGGANSVEVSINGGGYSVIPFYQNGYDIGIRAAHTIIIRIPVGGTCRIDEFWAI